MYTGKPHMRMSDVVKVNGNHHENVQYMCINKKKTTGLKKENLLTALETNLLTSAESLSAYKVLCTRYSVHTILIHQFV